MKEKGIEKARTLTIEGFHYENLVKMAQVCREETIPNRPLSAYTLHCF